MPSRQEVAQFLNEFKAAVSLGRVKWLRRANTAKMHLSRLDITQNQAIDYLLNLTPDDYSKGPEPDDFQPLRNVWVFGRDVDGTEAYVKLATQPGNRSGTIVYAIIWSFHAAEHPMRYPFGGSP